MLDNIKKVLEKELYDNGFIISSIDYKDKTLLIVLDSDEVIDSNRITMATKIISPILDKYDFIKENYVLDVSSLEKGGN